MTETTWKQSYRKQESQSALPSTGEATQGRITYVYNTVSSAKYQIYQSAEGVLHRLYRD